MSRATGVVVASCAALGFVVLGVGLERDPLESVDAHVADAVVTSLPTALELVARPFSWIGGWIGMTALATAMTIVLARERAWGDFAFLAVALLGSAIAVALLKASFDRERPDVGSAVPLPESASFPSGHATSGVAGLGALAVLTTERLPSRRGRVWLWCAMVVVGAGVGLSRVALNVHYLTDVLAGWCLGVAWLAACLLVRERFARTPV